MRRARRRLGFLVALWSVAAWAGTASADITTEKGSSILVWPKIIANGTRDTLIQITNTSNSQVRAHCFYVNGALANPDLPQGPLNQPLWQEIDFTIQLTRQQPTQWTVSLGRAVNPLDPACNQQDFSCPDAGFDPGRVPPVVPDFTGELKCIEVDESGAPVAGNHLLGLATIFEDSVTEIGLDSFVVVDGASKYNAIGVQGDENNGDDVLVLGGGQCAGNGDVCQSDDDCGDQGPCAAEYGACPQTWILNHLADGAPNLALLYTPSNLPTEPFSETELTIVPCTQNFETQIPTTVTLQFITINEFESQFSVSTSITCWGNFRLGDIGATALTFAGQGVPDPQGTMFLQTRMRSAGGTPYGVMMVAEEFTYARQSTGPDAAFRNASTDAVNLQVEGQRTSPDLITVPADQLQP
jgi:hypothetical protein